MADAEVLDGNSIANEVFRKIFVKFCKISVPSEITGTDGDNREISKFTKYLIISDYPIFLYSASDYLRSIIASCSLGVRFHKALIIKQWSITD